MEVVPISGNEVALCFSHHLLSTRSIQATITMSKLTSDGYIEYIIVLLDRSKQRQIEKQLRNSKEYLERLATHDALTGLPNRIHFTDALRAAMLNSRKAKRELALLYFDIDGFKAINDQHGHHVGDSLLREIANRLRVRTVEVGKLARLGGDELIPYTRKPKKYAKPLASLFTPHQKHCMYLPVLVLPYTQSMQKPPDN